MKDAVRMISAVLALLFAGLCLAGCAERGLSAEEMEDIEKVQDTFPDCEFVGKRRDHYIFTTQEGIEFFVYEGTTTVLGKDYRTLYSNYFFEVLSHYEDQLSKMGSDSVSVGTSHLQEGEAEIYFESEEDIAEAAKVFCDIGKLCHADEIDMKHDDVMDGVRAVSFMVPIGTFYCKDPQSGEYVCFNSLVLECDTEGVAEWLTECYNEKISSGENIGI